MLKRATIDIGSNTILLLAAELDSKKITREVLNCSEVTALGKNLDKTKAFADESMHESFKALKMYKDKLNAIGIKPDEVIVTATEASRVAQNSQFFFQKIKQELGFGVTIISPQGEAHYSALGAALDLKLHEAVVMDIGGASTELIKLQLNPFKVVDFISMPIGSVRGTDWLLENTFEKKINDVFVQFQDKLPIFKTQVLCCVAGTMTSIANIFHGKKVFEEQIVHGTKIKISDFANLIDTYKNLSSDELLENFPFLGKRSKTIIAGSFIGHLVSKKIEAQILEVSTYGLRYGTLIEGKIQNEFIIKQY
jgi:exopolyphosphatase/guanosine-5'-triphosphate,3'-diphosphate pyrophosphatase